MKYFFKTSILLALLICLSLGAPLYTTPEGIPVFKIDLNMEPKHRFSEVTRYFKEDALVVINLYKDVIG